MDPCSVSGCVSLATKADRCAVHAAGYMRAVGPDVSRRCTACQGLIKKAEWIRSSKGGFEHVHCPAAERHPSL